MYFNIPWINIFNSGKLYTFTFVIMIKIQMIDSFKGIKGIKGFKGFKMIVSKVSSLYTMCSRWKIRFIIKQNIILLLAI